MKLILPIFFLFFSVVTFSQSRKPKVPSYFGFQVKPILPTNFIGQPVTKQEIKGFKTVMTQRTGYSFGGVVRAGVTKLIAIETGINFNQRNFDLDISYPDSNAYGKNDMSFVTYDIPIRGLVYIQLADQWFMNTAIGTAITYNPTNVGVITLPGGFSKFRHTGLGKKVNFEINASIGFEFRTEKKGFFYLGAYAAVPVSPIMYLKSEYDNSGFTLVTDAENTGRVDGSFFAFEFKYFFPIVKKKDIVFQEGPINQ